MSLRLTFRRTSEDLDGFDWDEENRDRHFAKHGIDFPIVGRCDWSNVKKAPDTRTKSSPPRAIALAYCPPLDRVLVVVYAKRHRIAKIISLRLANAEETRLFHA